MTKRELPPPFTLSESAQAHIAKALAAEPAALGLRVGLKGAGCSGNKYTFEIAKEQRPADRVATVGGFRVFIDPKAEINLIGSTLDIVVTGPNKVLDFVNNPNESARCGCGESVMFKAQP